MDNFPPTHNRPERLELLCRTTKFSRHEIQRMYRGFKQDCPSGIVDEDTLKQIYAQFFPQGNASLYAHFVFKTFQLNRNGQISFHEFLNWLSSLSRGTLHDKLRWAFTLYDINGDGHITRQEMLHIVSSIYDMMGNCTSPAIDEMAVRNHVDRIFQKLDVNKDGVVTIDEFMDTCTKDSNISKSMQLLDTVLWCSTSNNYLPVKNLFSLWHMLPWKNKPISCNLRNVQHHNE